MKHIIIQTETLNGIEYRKEVPYVPPDFPPRPYIIEALDGSAVLLTPGQKTTYVQDRDGHLVRSEAPAARKVNPAARSIICEGYRPLADRTHATRMTESEAVAFAKQQGWLLADCCPAGATATHQLIAI